MRSVLHKINSFPFEAIFCRYYPVAGLASAQQKVDLMTSEGWDEVRSKEGHFLIPETRAQWQRMCETPIMHDSAVGDLPARAYSILDQIQKHQLGEQLYSIGVGLAALEYHIKRLNPQLELFCSDYGPVSVNRLGKVFYECDGIHRFDVVSEHFRSVYPNAKPKPLLLIHRVDPQLSDDQWVKAFRQLRESAVGHILLVPYQVLTLRHLFEVKRREYWCRVMRTYLAFCGYVRTRRRWLQLWTDSFNLITDPKIGYSQGFLLKSRP